MFQLTRAIYFPVDNARIIAGRGQKNWAASKGTFVDGLDWCPENGNTANADLTTVLNLGYTSTRAVADHDPPHVHVFEDGKRVLKFDIESWTVMEGTLTARARKALEALREEGAFDEESEI